MAGDPFRRVNPGDQQAISAAAWNALMDLLRRDRSMSDGRRPPRQFVEPHDTGVVLVQNETGGTVGRSGVLALGDPVILPSERQEQFRRRVAFKGHVPGEDTPPGRFCVLQEILTYNGGQGSIGRAVLSGLTIVKLFTTGASVDHPFAECVANDATRLGVAATGTARVMWSEDDADAVAVDGGYERWAVVRLGDGSGGDGAGGVTVTNLTTNYGTPITISSSTNNLATPPTYGNVLTVTNTPNLTGIVAGVCGQRLLFVNGGSTYLVLRNEDAASTDVNRFRTPYEQHLIVPPDFAFELLYDCIINRWRVLWVSDILNPGTDQPATISTTQNDYVFDFRTPSLTLDLGANVNFTGLFGGVEGYLLRVSTIYTTPDEWVLTLKHLNAGSDAANQIVTPGGVDFKVASGGGVYLYYGQGKWRVLATREVYATPNKLIAVGANKLPEERAGFEVVGNQLRAVRNDGAGRPEMALLRQGSSGSNLGGGESLGGYLLKGQVGGTEVDLSGVESEYGGTGSQQTANLKSFTYDAGVKKGGWIQHSDGAMEFVAANTANKYLGTDASGKVVTKDAAATLTETYVGVGDATDSLSGSSSFTSTVGTMDPWVTVKVPSPGGYRVLGFASASTALAKMLGGHADGSGATPATTSDGRVLARIGGIRYDSGAGGWQAETAYIDFIASDTTLGYISFVTNSTERMRILSDGHIRFPGLTASTFAYINNNKDLHSFDAGTEGEFIRQGAVTPDWAFVKGEILNYASVAADQSTTSTTYTDLSTTLSVSVTVEASMSVIVRFRCTTYNDTALGACKSKIYLDGVAETGTGVNEQTQSPTANVGIEHQIKHVIALTAGTYTISVKHATDSTQTGHWINRSLEVCRA